MPSDHYIRGKNRKELLSELYGPDPGSIQHEQIKMAIIVECADALENAFSGLKQSMNRNADSSQQLAEKVLWLNVILTVATVAGVLITGHKLFF